MESLRITPTGTYFRMDDGRVGYANSNGYARISVAREGLRNGEWFSEPCEISDRFYQINKKIEVSRGYTNYEGITYDINGYERVKYKSFAAALSALIVYNRNNCQPINVLKRERDTWKSFYKGMLSTKKYDKGRMQDHYNIGFANGVDSMCDKLNKLMINL